MKQQGTLLLSKSEIAELLSFDDYFVAAENAFRLHDEGQTIKPALLHVDVPNGEFHIKAGGLKMPRPFFSLKANGGFFRNRELHDMPNIQGSIILADAENGYPLAIMDSTAITRQRTAAATAVAAKYLARQDSSVLTICGCGSQGRASLIALAKVLPLKRAFVYCRNQNKAEEFAFEMTSDDLEVEAVWDLGRALAESDVCVTCTPAKNYFLRKEYVRPGMFIAAVGADSPAKQELEPGLLAGSIVVDVLEQCVRVGEIHHAIDTGLMNKSDVYAELGDVVAGKKPGRISDDETIIFDSTGTAFQDAAAAAIAYEKAVSLGGYGTRFDLYG